MGPLPGCQWKVKVNRNPPDFSDFSSPNRAMKRQEAGKHLSSGKSLVRFFLSLDFQKIRDEHFLPSYLYISGLLHKD